jgi:hypothetical protein
MLFSVRYRFLVVRSGVPDFLIGTIMESRDTTFFENIFPMRDETSSSRQESIEKDDSTKSMDLNEPTFIEHLEEDNMRLLRGARDKVQRNPLEMISSYTALMTLLRPLQRHTIHLMLTIGRKQ